jgi:hypothetical protein
VPAGLDLNSVFRLEEARTLTNDWVVRYGSRSFQVARQGRRYPPAQSTVQVCEYEDGRLEARYRDRVVPWTEIPAPRRATTPPTAVTAERSLLRSGPRRRPAATHPWRQGYQHLAGHIPWSS